MLETIATNRLLITFCLVLVLLVIRQFLRARVKRSREILTADERRQLSSIHYTTLVLGLSLVFALWLPQIQHMLLSLTAIALALVIVTKELTLCFLGAMLRRTSNSFEIGDWISVGSQFGEVIENNLLTTLIHEIETRSYTFTGRTITIPNSAFLSQTQINQNFLRRYQFHRFSIVIDPVAFPMDAEDRLLKRIEHLSKPFSGTAERYNAMLEKRTGVDIPDANPLIEFGTNETGRIVTHITLFCPTESIAELEKALHKEFFSWYRSNRVA